MSVRSELAWIDAVGGAAFLAAKLDAAGGEHHEFGPDGVRIDGAGYLVWEGVETTIDGPDWVAVVLTYGPDRRAFETVRRRLAAEANACPTPGRCGLFVHATDCPRRPSPLAAPGAPIRRDRTAPTIDIDHTNRPHHTAAFRGMAAIPAECSIRPAPTSVP